MTIIIIAITALVSILAFNKPEILYKYQFNPYQIVHRKQYLRLLSHALLHANWAHLIINMLVLFSFGQSLEKYFSAIFPGTGMLFYLLMYISAIVVSSLYSLIKNKDNYMYNAVGASGAVSAVLYSSILFDPWSKIYFLAIIPIPAIIFAVLYLLYSWQMSKKSQDNIAHDAHFFGAVFGLIFPIILKPELFTYFIQNLISFR